jgi:hypothetical protein
MSDALRTPSAHETAALNRAFEELAKAEVLVEHIKAVSRYSRRDLFDLRQVVQSALCALTEVENEAAGFIRPRQG